MTSGRINQVAIFSMKQIIYITCLSGSSTLNWWTRSAIGHEPPGQVRTEEQLQESSRNTISRIWKSIVAIHTEFHERWGGTDTIPAHIHRQELPTHTHTGTGTKHTINHQFFSVQFDRNSRHPIMQNLYLLCDSGVRRAHCWQRRLGIAQRGLRPTKGSGRPIGHGRDRHTCTHTCTHALTPNHFRWYQPPLCPSCLWTITSHGVAINQHSHYELSIVGKARELKLEKAARAAKHLW